MNSEESYSVVTRKDGRVHVSLHFKCTVDESVALVENMSTHGSIVAMLQAKEVLCGNEIEE